jgi:peroxiredoxin
MVQGEKEMYGKPEVCSIRTTVLIGKHRNIEKVCNNVKVALMK